LLPGRQGAGWLGAGPRRLRICARRNPYAKRLKKAVTIRLQPDIMDYFKAMAADTGIPYQNLINLYLLDCAAEGRRLSLEWRK